MKKKEVKITGTVTEVRILSVNDVIVFVKVGSPERIQDKIVRFRIKNTNANCLADCDAWTMLAVGDGVQITCIYSGRNTSYELYVVHSEILDANGLINEGL